MNGEAFTAFWTIGVVTIRTSSAFGQISRVSVRWLARSETYRTLLKGRREGDEINRSSGEANFQPNSRIPETPEL